MGDNNLRKQVIQSQEAVDLANNIGVKDLRSRILEANETKPIDILRGRNKTSISGGGSITDEQFENVSDARSDDPFLADKTKESQYEDQSGAELAGNAIAQFLGSAAGGALMSAGTTLDVQQTVNTV